MKGKGCYETETICSNDYKIAYTEPDIRIVSAILYVSGKCSVAR